MSPTVDVSIVGHCAEKVIFHAADPTRGAINLDANVHVSASNMTLLGYHATVGMTAGDLTLDSVVIDGSHFTGIAIGNAQSTAKLTNVVVRGTRAGATDANAFGLYVGYGAKVTVTNSEFADNDYINVGVSGDGRSGASLLMSQSVVRDGHPLGTSNGFGWGVYGSNLVTIGIDQSAIVGNRGFGVLLNSTSAASAAKGTITASVVRGTAIDPGNVSAVGIGVESNKSTLDIEQTTIADSSGVDVYGSEGSVKMTGDTLLGTSSADPTVLGPIGLVLYGATATLQSLAIVGASAGAEIEGATTAEMDDSLIDGTKTSSKGYYVSNNYVGVGIFVETAAQITLKNTTIENAHTAGLITLGQTTATGLVVLGTRAGGDGIGGRAVSSQGGATIAIAGSAFLDNIETGVLAAQGSTLTLTDSTVDQTGLDEAGRFGIGVLLADDQTTATISSTTLRRGAGPGLAVSASGATVTSCAVLDNAIGVSVQGGSSLVEGLGNGDPQTVAISNDTIFVGNATRVGSGDIPLPPVLTTPKP